MSLTDKETIDIPVSHITGSRVKEGSHLESYVCGLLDEGYPVTVGNIRFTASNEFSMWYKASDPKNYPADVKSSPEDDDLGDELEDSDMFALDGVQELDLDDDNYQLDLQNIKNRAWENKLKNQS
jgi:hypothetical protein